MTVVTSAEIVKKAGLKDAYILTLWHNKYKLLPPPLKYAIPGATVNAWPVWVLDRVKQIQKLYAQGISRAPDIKRILIQEYVEARNKLDKDYSDLIFRLEEQVNTKQQELISQGKSEKDALNEAVFDIYYPRSHFAAKAWLEKTQELYEKYKSVLLA